MLRDETLSSIKVRDWTRWGQHEFTIQFSDQDQQDLAAFESRLIEIVPTILTDSLLSMEVAVLKDLKRGWPKYRKAHDKDMAGFRKRLRRNWGAGFSLLEMLITIATEAGSNWKGTPQFPALTDAHRRLHARACQSANEVVTLWNPKRWVQDSNNVIGFSQCVRFTLSGTRRKMDVHIA